MFLYLSSEFSDSFSKKVELVWFCSNCPIKGILGMRNLPGSEFENVKLEYS